MEQERVLPDFKDIETKMGRKVPEILVRSLVECLQKSKEDKNTPSAVNQSTSSDLKRLESKMLLLKEEMAHLRAIDIKLMQQLLTINEGIESIKWAIEEKGVAASHDSSLAGSLYSLSESPDGSLQGSYSSLPDGSEGLDAISVGSYLDTLAEDVSGHTSPSDLELLSDGGPSQDVLKEQCHCTELQIDTEEYYCFG